MNTALMLSRFNKYVNAVKDIEPHGVDVIFPDTVSEAQLRTDDLMLVQEFLEARDARLMKMRHELRRLILAMEECGANAIAIGIIKQILVEDTEELLKEE